MFGTKIAISLPLLQGSGLSDAGFHRGTTLRTQKNVCAFVCAIVCVCACVRERKRVSAFVREREGERKMKKETEREREIYRQRDRYRETAIHRLTDFAVGAGH